MYYQFSLIYKFKLGLHGVCVLIMKRKWTVSGSDFLLVQCYSNAELYLNDFAYFNSVGANLSLQNPQLYALCREQFQLEMFYRAILKKN